MAKKHEVRVGNLIVVTSGEGTAHNYINRRTYTVVTVNPSYVYAKGPDNIIGNCPKKRQRERPRLLKSS